ncbi:alkylmercury lyase family protein [Streptomyces sp. NPDC002082]|uniref:alkylmercury lyase family protein n=1 Tax=Streptomyces sp. NPDC002082 TaxID=3154772 RepID=UPI003318B58F
MRITVLAVPECPNAPVALERITTALDGRLAEVELVEVREDAGAARWGMTGSPTVLLDGVDPFTYPGAAPSVSCRIYRSPDGRTDGAPGVDDLREAFAGAAVPQSLEPDEDCCEADPLDLLDPIGRAGRGRRAPAEGGLRAVQQAVLRHFASTGRAPEESWLEPIAATAGRTAGEVLAELAREDFLTLDRDGQISAAYPFSAVPTAHRVTIDGGVRVWSMCAIDALGIPPMLGTDAVITSTDPVTGEKITVTSRAGHTVWEPPSAVVFVGRRSCSGPAAAVCCDALNFFKDTATARSWAALHPDVTGQVVGQERAQEIGRQTFGALLTRD